MKYIASAGGFPGSSACKESTCNEGDPGLILGSGRPAGEGAGHPTPLFLGFPGGSNGKESASNAEDLSLIPGLGRSPGGGMAAHSSILALFKIPMDRGAWRAAARGVTEGWTRPSD